MKHEDLFVLMFLLFIILPILGAITNFLFANDLAIGTVVVMGLIAINYLVFKDKI